MIVVVLCCDRCGREQTVTGLSATGELLRPWGEAVQFATTVGWRILPDGTIVCPVCRDQH